ncbi:hypothetical protein Mal52_25430 [Symmachiella dynata]|uniref:Uncharacterized protein n=1 Tax=Symmachiella dynata TaxID=2527995 RepID=A0A517ZNL0_9PLAN|nr:hypothetical protein Mal52_25430 [Symmachiella dynata]
MVGIVLGGNEVRGGAFGEAKTLTPASPRGRGRIKTLHFLETPSHKAQRPTEAAFPPSSGSSHKAAVPHGLHEGLTRLVKLA